MEKPVPSLVNVCELGIGVAVPRAPADGVVEVDESDAPVQPVSMSPARMARMSARRT
jgi:hypothetical protein